MQKEIIKTELTLIDSFHCIMDRIHNTELTAFLNYQIKKGNISQPHVNHADPTDYSLSREQAIRLRIKYLRTQREPLQAEYEQVKIEMLAGTRPYGYIAQNYLNEQIEKLDRDIFFNIRRLRQPEDKPSYDLEAIKKIPIDRITKINSNNFFQDNPFRTEKSPSNSLFWYRAQNRWTDFGSGQSGDVVDIYMAVNSCDFKTALKELTNLI
jgi:hypothetical protein